MPSKKVAKKTTKAARTVESYLANIAGERRAALDRLRHTLRNLLPAAEECISYGLPAFRVDGRVVAGFAATAKGCSYYPFSSATLRTLADDLKAFKTTKGALQFTPDKPLSVALVRKLVKTRLAEAH